MRNRVGKTFLKDDELSKFFLMFKTLRFPSYYFESLGNTQQNLDV